MENAAFPAKIMNMRYKRGMSFFLIPVSKGVTPYSYLEKIRIGEAKKLLEQGFPPIEAALRTGFSDQSHFTNYFNRFIGLSPGVYREIFLAKSSGEDKSNGK